MGKDNFNLGPWDFLFDADTETIERELYSSDEYQGLYGFEE